MLHKRAVFFDRDGTLLEHTDGDVSGPEHVRVYPGVADSIALLNDRGFRVIVVTNQAGVGRGVIGEIDLLSVHNHLKRYMSDRGARIDAVLYSTHHPAADHAEHRRRAHRRKPGAGMLDDAARRFSISLKDSFLVGDSPDDLAAARAAGAQAVLVRTGRGRETEAAGGAATAACVADDASTAAVWICRQVCDTPLAGKRVLMVVAGRNFQDREYRVTRLRLEAWGADIRVAGPSGPSRDECVSDEGARVRPDTTVKDAATDTFDAIVFVGGEGARAFLDCKSCQSLARMAIEKKKVVAAICVSPSILANAYLLARRKAAAWHTELSNLRKHGAVISRRPVVRDGDIVTAAGPRDAEAFADEIRAAIAGDKKVEMTVAVRTEAS